MAKFMKDWDFGFSAVDEDELKQLTGALEKQEEVEELSLTVTDLHERLTIVNKMISPLLHNLASNPDKQYIFWPDRSKKISAFKNALDDVFDLRKPVE
jgi:hypothetical protein